jgi:hypothetical protein
LYKRWEVTPTLWSTGCKKKKRRHKRKPVPEPGTPSPFIIPAKPVAGTNAFTPITGDSLASISSTEQRLTRKGSKIDTPKESDVPANDKKRAKATEEEGAILFQNLLLFMFPM